MLAAFAFSGIFPFGAKSILASDLQDQYIHVIAETANKLKAGESLFISHKAGFGTNFLIQAQPYLSIIYLPFLFFKTQDYQEVYTCIYLLRLALTGLSASFFFRHSSAAFLSGKINAAFSVMYSLIMFNVTNQINIFFMNDTAMLPLCFLGVEQLIQKKRIAPFAAAYFICVIGGYYNMPFITGTACFIYFIYFAVITGKKPKQYIRPFAFLILSAIIAGLLSAITLIPLAKAVSGSYNKVFSFGSGSIFAYGIPYICRNLLFINDGAPAYAETPGMFIGIMPIFLTLWFIFSSNACKREKAAAICIFIFYFMSFHLAPLYSAMHFFRLPMGYDGRYTYGMALIYLVFAARAVRITQKKSVPIPFVIIAVGIMLALNAKTNTYYLVFAAAVILLSLFYTLIQKSGKKAGLIAIAVLFEAFACACVGTHIITKYIIHPDHNGFKAYLSYTQSAADSIKKQDPGFYRAVDLYSPCKLFQLCAGYNSISTFLSTANQNASNYAKALGVNVPTDGRAISNTGNSIAADSIFGIKYLFAPDKRAISTDTSDRDVFAPDGMRLTDDIYREIQLNETAACFENTTAFPLMFSSDEAVIKCKDLFKTEFGSYFKNQEIFLNAVCSQDRKFFRECRLNAPEIYNCSYTSSENGKYKLVPDTPGGDRPGIVRYTYNAENDGEYCAEFYIENPNTAAAYQSYAVYVNGCALNFDYMQNDTMHDIGRFKAGDIIDIQIIAPTAELSVMPPILAEFDTSAFKTAAAAIKDGALTDIRESNGSIFANAAFDKESFIFTSLSCDKGYTLYIDGKKTAVTDISNAFMGFYVPAGSHSIRLDYQTPGVIVGAVISAVTAALLMLLFAIKNIRILRK